MACDVRTTLPRLAIVAPLLFVAASSGVHMSGGAFKNAIAPSGGGSAELRCIELGSSCGASEPMNTASFTTSTGGACADGVNANFSDSSGSTELGNSAWTNCGGLSMVPASGDAGLPSGATASYVAKLSPVSASGREMAVSGVPAGTQRHCTRVYTRFSTAFRGFSGCGANKITEFWGGGITKIQLSEAGGEFNLWAGGMSSPPNHSSSPLCTGDDTPYRCCNGNGFGCEDVLYSTGNDVFPSDCTNNWCRVEMCVSGADVESGNGLTLEGYVTQVGVASPKRIDFTATNVGNMAGSFTETWVRTGYRETCSSGSDYFYMSHGMTANWPTNSGQTIGAACEVEGGCTFARSTGLQTNQVEVDRFIALSGSGSYATDRTSLNSHASTASGSWPYTITAGAWESDTGRCEPVGSNQAGAEFEVSFAATDILAMALAGYIENNSTYKANARTRLLEMTAITDFEAADLSGGNQCILDLGSAAAHLVEAALFLEDSGYSGWTQSDRVQLANWLSTEVFPLVSWGIDSRKNNWGVVTFASALAIAAYVEGGVSLLTKHNGTTISPSAYLAAASTPLGKWLSTAAGNELDSASTGGCANAGRPFGLQSYGAFPDELRRTGDNTANCSQTSLAFDSPPGNATFYQQKTTNGLGHICEILRRIDGNGARCFDIVSHGGDDEALYDAAQFSCGTTFSSYILDDNAQGFRYVAGAYYGDAGLRGALDDGSVSVRGGRDYAYTRITHAVGVAYP